MWRKVVRTRACARRVLPLLNRARCWRGAHMCFVVLACFHRTWAWCSSACARFCATRTAALNRASCGRCAPMCLVLVVCRPPLGRCVCACACLHARVSQCGCWRWAAPSRSHRVGMVRSWSRLCPRMLVAVLDTVRCVRTACVQCFRVLPCEISGRGLDVNPLGLTSTCAYALTDPRVGAWVAA